MMYEGGITGFIYLLGEITRFIYLLKLLYL